jgi:hypothetical protein
MHVHFDAIHPEVKRLLHGTEGVFRCVAARTAMAEAE